MKETFSIKIDGKVFESDEGGYLNLNDIWNTFNLPNKNRPSEWRNKVAKDLRQSGDLRIARKSTTYNEFNILIADEHAAVAYAMWVSLDFYKSVLNAFVELRRGNLEEAVKIAASTMSKEDSYYLKKKTSQAGMLWLESCWFSGIKHPNLLMDYLHKNSNWNYFERNEFGTTVATELGIEKGYFYNRGNIFTRNCRLCITPSGREVLRKYNKELNKLVNKSLTA